jgi:hypothetical protein
MLLIFVCAVFIPAFGQENNSTTSSSNPVVNWWDQDTLTGDWGGVRSNLAERGISFSGFWDNDILRILV